VIVSTARARTTSTGADAGVARLPTVQPQPPPSPLPALGTPASGVATHMYVGPLSAQIGVAAPHGAQLVPHAVAVVHASQTAAALQCDPAAQPALPDAPAFAREHCTHAPVAPVGVS
jgi:hypothetical protein